MGKAEGQRGKSMENCVVTDLTSVLTVAISTVQEEWTCGVKEVVPGLHIHMYFGRFNSTQLVPLADEVHWVLILEWF